MPIHHLHLAFWDVRTWTLVGQAPFLILVAILYWSGRQRDWPWRSCALVTGAFVAGLSLGTAFLPSVLGAAAGGIALWFLAQKALGLRRPPIAALALGLAGLIAVGRWGCLLNGCCFGTLTDLPWAVHYDSTSSAYFLHQALGLLAPNASHALGVHPYPLYESAGLFLWLPIGFLLARRLRSEGALLAFTAAFDLALRGFIDGKRAMINVWWSVLGQWHGLNLFQWALLGCAFGTILLGLLFERRARMRVAVLGSASVAAFSPEPNSLTFWLAYLGLCLVGWLSHSAQTVFLHRALLVALALCIPALTFPRSFSVSLRVRAWGGYGFATLLLLALGFRLETGAYAEAGHGEDSAQATLGLRTSQPKLGWLYDVDRRRGVIIRVGNQDTAPATIGKRETILGIPPSPAANQPPVPPASQAVRGRTWVGGGIAGGAAKYSDSKSRSVESQSSSSDGSCSGGNTIYTTTTSRDRKALGGWGEVEREIPVRADGVVWLGGRAGMASETERTTVTSNDPLETSSSQDGSRKAYWAQAWAEYEDAGLALGLGVLGGYSSNKSASFFPGFHLRAGHPRVGLDLGYLDRMSFLGYQSGHFGASFAVPRGQKIEHPDDVAARIFAGAYTFPGARLDLFNVSPGAGVEIFFTPGLVIGLEGAASSAGAFGGLHLRSAIGY
jgi:prolipoprotein diacylglyceryltransferase